MFAWYVSVSGPLDFHLVIQVILSPRMFLNACVRRLHPCLTSLAEDGGSKWRSGQDSNSQPSGYEPEALLVRGTLQCKWVTTFVFYIYYMFWWFLGVFFPLIPNPLEARSYLLSILRKSKMAAINNPYFGNVLETPLIIRNRCVWCLYFGLGGQRIHRICFCFSISSIMSKSKMAAIKSLFFKECT